jgi:hypothetical protein
MPSKVVILVNKPLKLISNNTNKIVMKKEQEPAFPILGKKHTFQPELNGISKQFYAACAAIEGIMSNQEYLININKIYKETGTDVPVLVAKAGFEIANAMLEEEERLTKNG